MLSKGFPVRLIKSHNKITGVQISNKNKEEIIYSSEWQDNKIKLNKDCSSDIKLISKLYELSVILLPEVPNLNQRIIEFYDDYPVLIGIEKEKIQICTSFIKKFNIRNLENIEPYYYINKNKKIKISSHSLLNGLKIITALGIYYINLILKNDPRSGLKEIINLYLKFKSSNPEYIKSMHELLKSDVIDSGNIFDRFLTFVTESNELDKWINWLICQLRLDIPYNQDDVIEILDNKTLDIDQQRILVDEAIKSSYDSEIEGENIVRISEWANENNIKLIAGRLSRAFENQAHLFAKSKYIINRSELFEIVDILVNKVKGIDDLIPSSLKLLNLTKQKKNPSLTEFIGAIDHFEQNLIEYQNKKFKKFVEIKNNFLDTLSGSFEDIFLQQKELSDFIISTISLINKLREIINKLPTKDAAFVVMLQRLSPTGSINLANANLLRDVHPGKEEDLRDVLQHGAHNIYTSPGDGLYKGEKINWISKVGDWIEAIPLFINEKIVKKKIKSDTDEIEIDTIETQVDQDAMEVFFRNNAEFWAENINEVMDLEYIELARELIYQISNHSSQILDSELIRKFIIEHPELHEKVSLIAAAILLDYRNNIFEINSYIEKYNVDKTAALKQIINKESITKTVIDVFNFNIEHESYLCELSPQILESLKKETKRLSKMVTKKKRPLCNLHILTTESAGMTRGYIQTWLESEMSFYNIIKYHGMENLVQQKISFYRDRILKFAKNVINNFGMWVVVEEIMTEKKISEEKAIFEVIMTYKPIYEEVSKMGVFFEVSFNLNKNFIEIDDNLINYSENLQKEAIERVIKNNGEIIQRKIRELMEKENIDYNTAKLKIIETEQDYKDEFISNIQVLTLSKKLEDLNEKYPELCVFERVKNYIRKYIHLAKSTARQELILEHNLSHLTEHPLFYYQANGINKKYNLLYTPSRVNLGEKEKDSVVKWRQWVGGIDKDSAITGIEVYRLINEGGVEERESLEITEIQKTSENALCVNHFAGSNALALLINAISEGDQEDMADQMNLRGDRLVFPSGEGYGGYCVPKDGLFLAFVLSLTNKVKLKQMGVPDELIESTINIARDTILNKLNKLNKQSPISGHRSAIQISKICETIQKLGQPWIETASSQEIIANLSARWGVERMIIHAEQVNRFMVFYKAWLIYQALEEARSQNPFAPSDENARINLTAEYKATSDGEPVKDIRYSTGIRLFEIFSGTYEHLTYCLDTQVQNLIHLMFKGFDPDATDLISQRLKKQIYSTFDIDTKDKRIIERLKSLFPVHKPPADITLTSTTMASIKDIFHYTADTKLEEIADQVQTKLSDYLTEEQIRAHVEIYGGKLSNWSGLKNLPQEELKKLISEINGFIHPLVLKLRGPGRNLFTDIQGVDVFNTGIPFKAVLELADNAPKLVRLMLEGNPNSALAIVDGAAGKKRRAYTYRDIACFFAACEKIAGRKGVYKAIGLGEHDIKRIYDDMTIKRNRARIILKDLINILNSSNEQKENAIKQYINDYQKLSKDIIDNNEAFTAIREYEKFKRYGKSKKGDLYISIAKSKIHNGLQPEELDIEIWLAGFDGYFVVIGEKQSEIDRIFTQIKEAINIVKSYQLKVTSRDEVISDSSKDYQSIIDSLVRPEFIPQTSSFKQQTLVETSSKAVETNFIQALERRKALKLRALKAEIFSQREQGFNSVFDTEQKHDFIAYFNKAMNVLEEINLDNLINLNYNFGKLIAYTRNIFINLANYIPDDNIQLKYQIIDNIEKLFNGREIIFEDWKKLSGGYEDIGDITRISEYVKIDELLKAVELFYIIFCLAQTIEFVVLEDIYEDKEKRLWKNLTDFFAETINDHDCIYKPWAYSRIPHFNKYNDEEIYKISVKHHKWLYRYIRDLIVNKTCIKNIPVKEQDLLLGNFLNGNKIIGIGSDAPSEIEREWRAYNQLREISFMCNDGFPLPIIFEEFDPEIIQSSIRVNLIMLFPIGRTHLSRALREGPTLNKELKENGMPGVNIIITRYGEFQHVEGYKKPVLLINSGMMYLSHQEFIEALIKYKNLTEKEVLDFVNNYIENYGINGKKGIKVGLKFTKPIIAGVVIPYHKQILYESGILEDMGIPSTVQSLIFSDITYDKSIYSKIFNKENGVTLPAEINWLTSYNKGKSKEEIIKLIIEGDQNLPFLGLKKFSNKYPIILIKGASESGARNLKVFDLTSTNTKDNINELEKAAIFIYERSFQQNMVCQEVILSSPELWGTPEFIDSFIERQITEWNRSVNITKHPKDQIYGSLRIIASSSGKNKPYDVSHFITLNSLQLATNVGRGGTLEILLPEFILPEFRDQILNGLKNQVQLVMKALKDYAEKYKSEFEKKHKRKLGEDLRGVPYSYPNYIMMDYLITPIFETPGKFVEIQPVYDEKGKRIRSKVILENENNRFEGKIINWKFIHLEPNIGIGLWDRFNLREEILENQKAKLEKREININNIGFNDRIVLRNFVISGIEYLKANQKV